MIVDTRIFHWTKIRPLLCERRLWLATRFGTFLCRPCTTTTWNFRMQRLMAEVNTWRIIFPSLSLNLVAVPRNSTPGKFANIWHFEQVGTKFDKKKPCIFFLIVTFLLPSPSSKSLLKLVIFYDISIRRIAPWNEYLELVPAVLQFSSLTLYKAANFLGRTPSASRSQTSLSQWVSVLVKQIQLDYLLLLLVKTVEMLNSPTKPQLLNWYLLYWKLSLTPFSSSKGCCHHYLPAGVEIFLMISERRTSGWDKTQMIMLGMYLYDDLLITTVLSDR